MKKLVSTLLFISLTLHAAGQPKRQLKKCSELLEGGMEVSEAFILLASRKLAKDGHLPRAGAAVNRLLRVEDTVPFADVLEAYGITVADWKAIETVTFKEAVLGTEAFLKKLPKKLNDAQVESFTALNAAAEAAREKLKTLLASGEQVQFASGKTLMNEQDLVAALRRHSRDPKLDLSYLGVANVQEWRYRLLTENESLRTAIEKELMATLMAVVNTTNEIPGSEPEIIKALAEKMAMPETEMTAFFGTNGLFKDTNALVEQTRAKHASAFTKIIDRRYFTTERRAQMVEASRKPNVIYFKLAENQDLKDFDAVRQLSRALGNAPIIVAPAFAEIGLIPQKLDWLFHEPNVHFMVDRGLQITPDFYVVDHGFEDKRQNPFVGLPEIYEPTDRVVLFHPKVRAVTRATGNYDTKPGYLVTTGSMSDAAYAGKFRISMSTDERAQAEAEMNRSVLVVSRQYRSDKFGSLVGSANGIAPRRIRFTEARYGNPAGLFDLGKIYTDNGVVEVTNIPALVLGDLHLGNTDPLFLKATRDALEQLRIIQKNPRAGEPMQPSYEQGPVGLGAVVLHDLIDGGPNNRHNMESLLTRALNDKAGGLDLENHIQTAAAWLKQLSQLLPNTSIVIPVDNHGSDWLVKRLQEAKLFEAGRPKEVPLILQLMIDAINHKANPYERVFQYYGINTDQVLFMDKADTYRAGIDLQNPTAFRMVHGVEIGQHSHMGINGAKSISLAKLLVAYGANVTGHTHSSAEYGKSVKVGTGTPVRQDYHRGPSNSDASIALVYSDQAMQLLRLEKGSFIPSAEEQPESEFFRSAEYPRVLIRKMPLGPTTDQFRADPPTNRSPR
jgi:hypothetical protein